MSQPTQTRRLGTLVLLTFALAAPLGLYVLSRVQPPPPEHSDAGLLRGLDLELAGLGEPLGEPVSLSWKLSPNETWTTTLDIEMNHLAPDDLAAKSDSTHAPKKQRLVLDFVAKPPLNGVVLITMSSEDQETTEELERLPSRILGLEDRHLSFRDHDANRIPGSVYQILARHLHLFLAPAHEDRRIHDHPRVILWPASRRAEDIMGQLKVKLEWPPRLQKGGFFRTKSTDPARESLRLAEFSAATCHGDYWVGDLEFWTSGDYSAPKQQFHLLSGRTERREVFRLEKQTVERASAEVRWTIQQTSMSRR